MYSAQVDMARQPLSLYMELWTIMLSNHNRLFRALVQYALGITGAALQCHDQVMKYYQLTSIIIKDLLSIPKDSYCTTFSIMIAQAVT